MPTQTATSAPRATPNQSNTALVIVCFEPDADFSRRLSVAAAQFRHTWVIDNSQSSSAHLPDSSDTLSIISQGGNQGQGDALNVGCALALENGFDWAVTLDQDSTLNHNFLSEMLAAALLLPSLAALGSNYAAGKGGTSKIRPSAEPGATPCTTIITSGCLLDLHVWQQLGRFRADFFIDSIDHEYCLRLRAHGHKVAINPQILMQHSIGESDRQKRWRPQRHAIWRKYTISRNAILTLRERLFSEPLWGVRKLLGLAFELVVVIALEPNKRERLSAFFRGLGDGFKGIAGPPPPALLNWRAPTLSIIGVHKDAEAYPNVRFRIRQLQQGEQHRIQMLHHCGWSTNSENQHGGNRLLGSAGRMVWAHLNVTWNYLTHPATPVSYLPYPGIVLLWIFSWIPGERRKQRFVIDAFISLYDTVVIDRGLFASDSLIARMLFAIERRAYRLADRVIVDTPQTATYMQTLFDLDAEKVTAIALATNEDIYQAAPYQPQTRHCEVVFIGTFIPLHGIEVIVAAIELLKDTTGVHFTLIGDGQESPKLATLSERAKKKVTWVREWQSDAQLAAAIRRADLCLGIFGSTEKTQRVLPFKVYAYTVVGRAVITADTACTHALSESQPAAPWQAVPAGDPAALANAIKALHDDPYGRQTLAIRAREFYVQVLSNQHSGAQLEQLLSQTSDTSN